MAKKRKQLLRAKWYREKREFEEWRNSPDYKPVTFWDTINQGRALEEYRDNLVRKIIRANLEDLKNKINS